MAAAAIGSTTSKPRAAANQEWVSSQNVSTGTSGRTDGSLVITSASSPFLPATERASASAACQHTNVGYSANPAAAVSTASSALPSKNQCSHILAPYHIITSGQP